MYFVKIQNCVDINFVEDQYSEPSFTNSKVGPPPMAVPPPFADHAHELTYLGTLLLWLLFNSNRIFNSSLLIADDD
jgi:hypothetical protein